jgi:hypothetical protein
MKWSFFKRKANSEITVGSLWTRKQGDPFQAKDLPLAKVLAVKDGYVQYRLGALPPDHSMRAESFLLAYKPKR